MPIHSTFTGKKILTSHSRKTKLNLINVQMQPKRETQLLFYPGMLKYNDKWCIHEFKRVIWIYNMANIYITKHARLKSINQKKQFYSYMMAKKMYLSASSKKLQVP